MRLSGRAQINFVISRSILWENKNSTHKCTDFSLSIKTKSILKESSQQNVLNYGSFPLGLSSNSQIVTSHLFHFNHQVAYISVAFNWSFVVCLQKIV